MLFRSSPGHDALKINILRVPLTLIALPVHEKNRCNHLKQKSFIFISHLKVLFARTTIFYCHHPTQLSIFSRKIVLVFIYLQSENKIFRSKFQNIFDKVYMYFSLPRSPGYETLKINILRVPLTFIAPPIHEKNRCNRCKQKSSIYIGPF